MNKWNNSSIYSYIWTKSLSESLDPDRTSCRVLVLVCVCLWLKRLKWRTEFICGMKTHSDVMVFWQFVREAAKQAFSFSLAEAAERFMTNQLNGLNSVIVIIMKSCCCCYVMSEHQSPRLRVCSESRTRPDQTQSQKSVNSSGDLDQTQTPKT